MSTIYYRKSRKRFELTIDGDYRGSFKTEKQAIKAWEDLTTTLETHQSEYINQEHRGFKLNPMKGTTMVKTAFQRLLHSVGFCPRQRNGYICHGQKNRCGWKNNG